MYAQQTTDARAVLAWHSAQFARLRAVTSPRRALPTCYRAVIGPSTRPRLCGTMASYVQRTCERTTFTHFVLVPVSIIITIIIPHAIILASRRRGVPRPGSARVWVAERTTVRTGSSAAAPPDEPPAF